MSHKETAKQIQDRLKELGHEVQLGTAYEALATAHGFKSWNVMSSTGETGKGLGTEVKNEKIKALCEKDPENFWCVCNNEGRIEFDGWVIHEEYSSSNNAHSHYSGETGISHEMDLYFTTKGNFVLHCKMNTQWKGCEGESLVYIDDSIDNVLSFAEIEFGESRCFKWFKNSLASEGLLTPKKV